MDDRSTGKTDRDEIDSTASGTEDMDTDIDDTRQQDFALRNTLMSNTLGSAGASAAAGAAIGSGGDLGMEPTVDEERVADEESGER
jgi:hypothetical protein